MIVLKLMVGNAPYEGTRVTSSLTTQVKPKTLGGQEITSLETIFLSVHVVCVRTRGLVAGWYLTGSY